MKNVVIILAIVLSYVKLYSQEQHRQKIHCKHLFYGYSYGTPETNDLIIRDIYSLSNNDDTKFADWVCYHLDTVIISGATKSRYWRADPWLEEDETLKPKPDDYKSANAQLKTERGHQAPLASFDGSPYWYETNYLSNITPQMADLNGESWALLEKKLGEWLKS